MTLLGQLVVGSVLGILVALLAWRAGALDRSGAVAAALEGALIFGLGGVAWAVVLLGFFISSSALSKMFRKRSAGLSRRLFQVASTGSPARITCSPTNPTSISRFSFRNR